MKIYLAAMFSRQSELQTYKKQLESIDSKVQITSTWLTENFADPLRDEQASMEAAKLDLRDIDRSDIFVAFTSKPDIGYYTGGRHVEYGFALSRLFDNDLVQIYIVGPPENVFYRYPSKQIKRFDTFEELKEEIRSRFG